MHRAQDCFAPVLGDGMLPSLGQAPASVLHQGLAFFPPMFAWQPQAVPRAAEPSRHCTLRPFISLVTHNRDTIKTLMSSDQHSPPRAGSWCAADALPGQRFPCSWHKAAPCTRCQALWRRLCLGAPLSPAFLLAPVAIFAFWGAPLGAGRSPLPAAGQGVPVEGKAPRQGPAGKGMGGIHHPSTLGHPPWCCFAVVAHLEQHRCCFLLGLPGLLQPAMGWV